MKTNDGSMVAIVDGKILIANNAIETWLLDSPQGDLAMATEIDIKTIDVGSAPKRGK
jgi:hypothetical protein